MGGSDAGCDGKSLQTAGLDGIGVGQEDLVGVRVERSIEMVVGLLGVLKAGAAYVPLEPEQPGARLAMMMEDVGATVVLASEATRAALRALR